MSEREPVSQDTAKGPPETDPRLAGEKHPVARMLAIGVVASLIGIAICLLIDWFPADASGAAGQIDTLYDVLLICSVPVFVLVMTIAIYSVVRFRAKPGDMGDGPPIHGNTKLEVIWVTIPFIMVTALAIYGWIVLDDIEAKQQNEMVVNVTGQQFAWTFDYPGQNVNSNELVLPVDQPIDFRIKTKDVLHSFWVPAFRLKSDAVPGLTTKIRLTPDRIGRYEVVCAELCGLGHSTMRQFVRVLPADQFDAWARRQVRAGEGGAEEGESGEGSGGGGGVAVAVASRRPRASRSSPPRAAAPATRWPRRTPAGRSAPIWASSRTPMRPSCANRSSTRPPRSSRASRTASCPATSETSSRPRSSTPS